VSLKRKLVAAGAAILVIAGGATGAAIAASGNSRSLPPAPHQLRLAGTSKADFLRATARYLGTDVATLRHDTKGAGRTLAEIADATQGRSAKELSALLVAAASTKLQLISDRAMSLPQRAALGALLRHRITGFLNDTCPLALGALAKHLAGCPGMMG
jgi:hypothetical protein